MKSSTMVLVGGAGLMAAMLLFSQKETDVLVDDATPSYVTPDKITTPDNKDTINQGGYDYAGELLPSTNMWNVEDGKTIRIYHPLKDNSEVGEYFDSFYFDVKLTVDFMSSIYNPDGDKTINDFPENLGDYVWELTRSGGWQDTVRWTTLQNGDDIRGLITKSNTSVTLESITPLWSDVLSSFGGYMQGKKVTGPSLTLSGGQFPDTDGDYRYVAYYIDGKEVATNWLASNMVGLQYTMSGEAISMNIKLKYRCGNSGNYTLSSSATYPFPSPYSGEYGTGGYYFPIETAPEIIRNPQGVSFGCTIPTKTSSYPEMIHVDGGEGLTGGSGATYTTTHTQIWELVPTAYGIGGNPLTWSGPVPNDRDSDANRAWKLLFDYYTTPKIFHDAQGLYVKSRQTDEHKIYLSNYFIGVDALYQRRSCTGVCPGGTVNAGQTITRYDTSQCSATHLSMVPECGGVATGGDGGGSPNLGGNTGGTGVVVVTLATENVNYILSSQSYINL
tara:strand:+ start:3992 stop:5497 length:1506 start_codon:yes stop_codon:yes gene_type:complete